MAFTCGFYNSVNHDRVYDADQMGDLFTGLINDGVYATVGKAMAVSAVSGTMRVTVGSGRAWFNKTWSLNTSDYVLTIPQSDMLLPRIDAVVLEVDTRLAVRNNSLKIISGRAASNPAYPTLTRANGVYQYPLAYVTVRANATSITQGNIEQAVGRSPTPYVTGIVQVTSLDQHWAKWEEEYKTWFDDLKVTMSDDVVKNMQSQIQALQTQISGAMTTSNRATTAQAQAGTSNTVWMSPANVLSFYNYRKATTSEAKAHTNDTNFMTPSKTYDAIRELMDANYVGQTLDDSRIPSQVWVGQYVSDKVLSDLTGKSYLYTGIKVTPNLTINTATTDMEVLMLNRSFALCKVRCHLDGAYTFIFGDEYLTVEFNSSWPFEGLYVPMMGYGVMGYVMTLENGTSWVYKTAYCTPGISDSGNAAVRFDIFNFGQYVNPLLIASFPVILKTY